jgi:heptosyltransferase-2
MALIIQRCIPIIPDGETTVKHNTFGKDKINPDKIFDKFISIIN